MKLEWFLLVRLHDKLAIFFSAETCTLMDLDHVGSSHFVHCEFDYWPFAVSMPPTKVCPQFKIAVPVRQKTCERCDHVF